MLANLLGVGPARARRTPVIELALTSLPTPESRQPRTTFSVPSTFVLKSASGAANERRMLAWPAEWNTSKRSLANSRSTNARSLVALDERRLGRHVLARPGGEVVEHGDRETVCKQALDEVRPDEPAPPVTRTRLTCLREARAGSGPRAQRRCRRGYRQLQPG